VSYVRVNGRTALEARVTIPRIGVPAFDVSLAGPEPLAPGPIRIEVGKLAWKAAVRRSGAQRGILTLRAVGGAGGFTKVLEPRAYQGAPARLALEDIAKDAGEALSTTCQAAPLAVVLPKWTRFRQAASFALQGLLSLVGAPGWRVLADGTIWIGHETWPMSRLDAFTVTNEAPHRGSLDLFAVDPRIFPGETLDGRRVSVVEHVLTDRRLSTRVWLEG
jgi:hypothetical protein